MHCLLLAILKCLSMQVSMAVVVCRFMVNVEIIQTMLVLGVLFLFMRHVTVGDLVSPVELRRKYSYDVSASQSLTAFCLLKICLVSLVMNKLVHPLLWMF